MLTTNTLMEWVFTWFPLTHAITNKLTIELSCLKNNALHLLKCTNGRAGSRSEPGWQFNKMQIKLIKYFPRISGFKSICVRSVFLHNMRIISRHPLEIEKIESHNLLLKNALIIPTWKSATKALLLKLKRHCYCYIIFKIETRLHSYGGHEYH